MKWFALCHVGAEECLARELASKGFEADFIEGACVFQASKEAATALLFNLQTATRLLAAVYSGPLDSLDLSNIGDFLPEDQSFAVRSESFRKDFDSHELSALIGEQIDRKVDLDNPDHTVFCQYGKELVCGLDIAGDLSKRYYRVFTHARSVKPTFAASLLYFEDWQGDIIDPFCGSGEIPIEAALRLSNTSPLKFRKHVPIDFLDNSLFKEDVQQPTQEIFAVDPLMGNLRTAEKNAKLASVAQFITSSRFEAEWMDVKFKESQLGAIITVLPAITKRFPDDDLIKEICYQAEYVLEKSGVFVAACMNEATAAAFQKYAKHYKLKLRKEGLMYMGSLPIKVLSYGV